MLAYAGIEPWHYGLFIVGVLIALAIDLGVFNREAHRVSFKEASCWTMVWFSLAMLFAFTAVPVRDGDAEPRMDFIAGYILELSLSMDNVFVIALVFTYFKVENKYQHRVLFWGIMGALIMRGIMIGIGAAAVSQFKEILILFGAFLFFTGIKLLFTDDDGVEPDQNPLVRLARRFFPVADNYDGQKFITRVNGRRMLTPLAIVLIAIEWTDVIFAVDSIPAIFVVTTDPFIVFTSNMFAILGLRSLYFVLANAIDYFHYLRYGLAFVLVFIGAKMLLERAGDFERLKAWSVHIPTFTSLLIVLGILVLSIVATLVRKARQPRD